MADTAQAIPTYTLSVDDTSPAIAYAPFADTFSTPNYNIGWNPAYTDSGLFPDPTTAQGAGASIHETLADNASLILHWNGTGISLFGYFPSDQPTVPSSLSYSISLDGTSTTNYASSVSGSDPTQSVLAAFSNLTNAEHTIELTVHNPDGLSHPSFVLQFDRAELIGAIPQRFPEEQPVTGLTDEMLPDDWISYRGKWSFETGVLLGQSLSFHASSNPGDRASVQFNGTSVALSGLTTPLSGSYNISLDQGAPETFSARSSFNLTSPTLLFFRTGLDPNTLHQLDIVNVGPTSGEQGSFLALSAVNVTSVAQGSNGGNPESVMSSSRLKAGTVAAIAVVACVAFIVLVVLAAIYIRKRRRDTRRKESFIVNPQLKNRRFSFMRARSRQGQRPESEKDKAPKSDPRHQSVDASILEIGARKEYTDDEEDEGNERSMLRPPATQHSRHGSQNSDGSFSIDLPELPAPGRGHVRVRSGGDSPTDTLRFASDAQPGGALSPTMSYATASRSTKPRGPREMRASAIARDATKGILLKEMYVPSADVPLDVREEGSQGSNTLTVPYLPQPYVSPLRVNFEDETQSEVERKAKRERTRSAVSAVSGMSLPASLRQALGWGSHPFSHREPSPEPMPQTAERQNRQLARHSFLDMDSSASQSLSSGSRSTRQSQTTSTRASSKSRDRTDDRSEYTVATDVPSIPQHLIPRDHDPPSSEDQYSLPGGDHRVSLGLSMVVAGGPTSSRPSLSPNVSFQAVPLPPLTVPSQPQTRAQLDVPESAHSPQADRRPYSPTHPALPESAPATAALTLPAEFLPSPTDSIPYSVSDIHFRHSTQSSMMTSGSEQSHGQGTQGHSTLAVHGHSSHGHGGGNGERRVSQRTPHPALPRPDERPYIIQRIVGTAGPGSGPPTPFATPTLPSSAPAGVSAFGPSTSATAGPSRSTTLSSGSVSGTSRPGTGEGAGPSSSGVGGEEGVGRGSSSSGRRQQRPPSPTGARPSSSRGGRTHNPMVSFSSLMSRPKPPS